MTSSVTHVWRLLRWGRVLARHGALRGIERDANDPAARPPLAAALARFGARVPDEPDLCRGVRQAIGPAAIKLGQALATRPDLVGEEAARDLAPPAGQPAAGALRRRSSPAIEQASRPPDRTDCSAEIDPGAGRRRLDRAGPPRGHHRGPQSSRSRCCARNIEEDFASAIETYEWAAAQVER